MLEVSSEAAEPDVETLAAEAQAAFEAGDYDRMLEISKQAYARSGNLAFLYAQAHAERFRGNCRDALGLYGRVIAADPDGPYAPLAREGIQICEAEPEAAAPEPEAEPEPVEPPPPAPVEPAPAADRRRPDPLGTALLATGAASAAASVVLFISGGVAANRADDAGDESTFDDARTRARGLMLGGGIAAGVAVALITGAGIRLSRVRRDRVAVRVSPEFVGLSVRSRF